jgi:soluble lytic murein transglycosylase-like protein
MGLMQLMPSTAKGLGVTNAFDAEQNIYGGTKYLKGLMDRFGNNKELTCKDWIVYENIEYSHIKEKRDNT